jgi:hypothetical protein
MEFYIFWKVGSRSSSKKLSTHFDGEGEIMMRESEKKEIQSSPGRIVHIPQRATMPQG